MSIEQKIKNVLDSILVPGANRSLVALNLVRGTTIVGGRVKLLLANIGLDDEARSWLERRLSLTIGRLSGVQEVAAEFVNAKCLELNQIKNVVAVMSGKGGVGKSLVTALLAIAFNRQGMDVGIFDADITGPSIPHMFGVKQRPAASKNGILPVPSTLGINIISMNLLLPHEDDLIRWRGAIISGTIRQFWEQVLWGNLDLLLVDLPPGTSDAVLTVMQALPLSGTIIVSTPQSLVQMIVRKTISLNKKMNVPILGVVENMSYLVLPDGKTCIEPFGESKAEEMANAAGTTLLGRIALDPALRHACDDGQIENYHSDIIDSLGKGLSQALKL